MTMNAPGLPLRTDYCPVDATSSTEPTLDSDSLRHAFYTNLFYVQGKIPTLAHASRLLPRACDHSA